MSQTRSDGIAGEIEQITGVCLAGPRRFDSRSAARSLLGLRCRAQGRLVQSGHDRTILGASIFPCILFEPSAAMPAAHSIDFLTTKVTLGARRCAGAAGEPVSNPRAGTICHGTVQQ